MALYDREHRALPLIDVLTLGEFLPFKYCPTWAYRFRHAHLWGVTAGVFRHNLLARPAARKTTQAKVSLREMPLSVYKDSRRVRIATGLFSRGQDMDLIAQTATPFSILLTRTVQESIESIAQHFDVDFVTLHVARNAQSGADNPYVRTTYPAAWVSHYLLHNLVTSDPILQKAVAAQSAFDWSEAPITAAGVRMMEMAMSFGLGAQGYSMPCSDSLGRKSVLSLNSRKSRDDWRAFLQMHAATLATIGRDLHIKAIAEATVGVAEQPQLSPREHECLVWTAAGKTYGEIAIILDLSEHTIRSYLKVARLKLDSVSMAQAVAKASSMGLI
jgi:LuxR family transcriptional regulator, quorum-sensing system regulator CinR